MTEQVILESTPLNALDRCDRCGAQAYVRATLATGGELMFCAHHGKEYAEKLWCAHSNAHCRIAPITTVIAYAIAMIISAAPP